MQKYDELTVVSSGCRDLQQRETLLLNTVCLVQSAPGFSLDVLLLVVTTLMKCFPLEVQSHVIKTCHLSKLCSIVQPLKTLWTHVLM